MTDRTPAVSVVVVNWNRKDLLAACLCSLRQQTYQDFELIVVDNGSTDGSADMVRQAFPEVRVIELDRNTGPCGGNNVGFRAARGRYVATTNNDTEPDPAWLEEMVRAIEARPDVGFCASKLVLFDRRDVIDTAGDYFSIAGSPGKIGHLDDAHKPEYNELQEVFGACAGGAMFRTDLLKELGGFDEDLFVNFEDVDLSFRAQLLGYRCLYVPRAVVHHHLHGTLQFYSASYVYYGHRNLEYVYVKNVPLPLLIKYFPLHVVDDLLSFGYFLMRGRGWSFVKGKLDALLALPMLIRKRRRIQRERKIPVRQLEALMRRDWLRLKLERRRRIKAQGPVPSKSTYSPE